MFLSRTMRGWPLGSAIIWEQGHGDGKTLTVVDGQQRFTALGARLLRPDGVLNTTPSLYLDLHAYGHAPDDAVIWHPEPRGLYSPTVHDLVSWNSVSHIDLDSEVGCLYMAAVSAFREAEMHIMLVSASMSDSLSEREVRKLFQCANSGGTPMAEADVMSLVGK